MEKIYFLLLATSSFTCSAFSQSMDQNYLHTRTMLTADEMGYSDKIEYFDGIGRPVETIFKIASPLKKDIVTMQEYDFAGRHSYTWLLVPIDDSSGKYVDAGLFKLKAKNSSIYQNDPYPHSKTEYEPSPLNRVKRLIPPGADWFGGGNAVDYYWSTNDASYSKCYDYQITNDNYSFQNKGLYAPNKLFKTSEYDEDNHRTEIFSNSLKQVVLKRVFSGSPHDTYYIYDDFDNLRYVVPPAAVDLLSETNISWNISNNQTVKDFVYYYEYDEKNNCTKKKLPGCDPIQMKYDRADRLIFSQDGNQKLKNEWTFFLYDVFGRQTVSGIWKSGNVPETKDLVVKTDYTGNGSLGGYIVNLSPLPAIHLLSVNYYDSYNLFISDQTGIDANKLKYNVLSGYDEAYVSSSPSGDLGGLNAKGMLTGTRTYQLDDPTKYTVSAIYYDHRGRVVQTHTSNHMGGFEDEYFALTFTGKVKQRQHVHSIPGKTTQTEFYTYTHDHAERLRSVIHKINNATAVTLAQYSYDEIGRLLTKKLATETSTYKYNIRSWLTQIEGSKFNQTLAYCSPVNGLSPEDAYNGNIGAMKWKAGDEPTERGYALIYDELNRLTSALYGEGPNIRTNLNRYNELLSYNKMGNIKTLQRQGKLDSGYGLIDNLAYTYNGNQLTKVSDAVTTPITYEGAFHFVDGADTPNEYAYDANGNLIKDLNKNITSITYNALNLPSIITFGDGKTVTYGYDASGSKLSVTYNMGNGVISKMEYAGKKVYKNGTLGTILTEEGYITFSGTTPKYHYYLKDHQGNNRVVIDQAGTVEQVNHYYPFGGLFGEGLQDSNQPYKYNGKEFDHLLGLNMYDYGARPYDPYTGEWINVDPLAEKYYSISPYVYCVDNPIRYIDPDGRKVKPTGIDELDMIKNTLPEEARQYVQLNKNGFIDNKQLNKYKGDSENVVSLKELVASDITINVTLTTRNIIYADNDGNLLPMSMPSLGIDSDFVDPHFQSVNGTVDGDTGRGGVALLPGKGISGVNSPDDNIHVFINADYTTLGQAEMYSHEANGHALMYIRTGNRSKSGHIFSGSRDINTPLVNMIINSRKETVKNMRKK